MADSVQEATSVQVSTTVAATPEQLYAMVADLTRMSDWSPENSGNEWVGGATGANPGARFKGKNANGSRRWQTMCTIVVAEPGRELSWEVRAFGRPVAVWRYQFAPDDAGGTVVTESMDDRRGMFLRLLGNAGTGVSDRFRHNTETMRVTLERLKAAAEAGATG
jgi:uncharacterized protein YndB with AHSA1/START domain